MHNPLFTQDPCQPVTVVPNSRRYASANTLSTASSNTDRHKPSDALNLQRSHSRIGCPPARDFVPWRFCDAACWSAWLPSSAASQKPTKKHEGAAHRTKLAPALILEVRG